MIRLGREEIEVSLHRARPNKPPGRDGIHNEMLKIEITLLTDLLLETWTLIGRTSLYPEDLQVDLPTPIYKKGDPKVPMNYRPVFMLSCAQIVI